MPRGERGERWCWNSGGRNRGAKEKKVECGEEHYVRLLIRVCLGGHGTKAFQDMQHNSIVLQKERATEGKHKEQSGHIRMLESSYGDGWPCELIKSSMKGQNESSRGNPSTAVDFWGPLQLL